MKKVTIQHQQIALVSKHGKLLNVLIDGTHYFFKNEVVEVFTHNQQILSAYIDNTELAQHAMLAPYCTVVNVPHSNVLLVSKANTIEQVLEHGIYIYPHNCTYAFEQIDISTQDVVPQALVQRLLGTPMTNYLVKVTVPYGNKALLFIQNIFKQQLEAGVYYYYKNVMEVHYVLVEMRQKTAEISGQEILSADKVSLRINAIATYAIVDAYIAVVQNKDYEKQVYHKIQMLLREHVGKFTLYQILTEKNSINDAINAELNQQVSKLGVQLEHCGIRDIILPGDVKDIMNKVLIAEKKAEANSIMRREETAATRSLLNTAKLMEENTMLYKLKEMEYVERIAEKISTIQLSGSGNILTQLKEVLIK
jgi:hypothetical protein